MKLKSLTILGILALGAIACSDDSPTNSSSDVEGVQDITYDGTTRVLKIDSGVTEVHLSGIKDKDVFFARANVRKNEEGFNHSIEANDASFLKNAVSRIKKKTSTKWNLKSSRRNIFAATSEIVDDHKYEIPTTEKKQLTKNDIEPGKTKRVFKVVNYRYYGADYQVVENPDENYKDEGWINLEFTVCAVSDNIIVWNQTSNIDPKTNEVWTYTYDDEEYVAEGAEKITQKNCENLRDKFESILPYETALFGEKSKLIFSKGGATFFDDPSEPVDIKRYTDLANFTNLLVYDFTAISANDPGVYGYFNVTDYNPSYEHFGYKSKRILGTASNEGNFLYFSTHAILHPLQHLMLADEKTGIPYEIYSALAHEYMHSLQHARKQIEQSQFDSNTAFGELLGLLCEYVMAPKLGIPASSDVVTTRFIPYRTEYLDIGLTESDYGNSLMYEAGFTLGAFLMHNYGGQDILSEMLRNKYDGNKAITAAIQKVTGNEIKMEEILMHFMEAMTCKGSEYAENMSKKLTITAGSESYTRNGINIFDLTEGGYASKELYSLLPEELSYMVKHIKTLKPGSKDANIKLHDGYGFHLFDVNVVSNSDTTTLLIGNNGTASEFEKLYVLVGDKE